MLDLHHRITYRLHTLLRGDDTSGVEGRIVYYVVAQCPNSQEFVVRLLRHNTRCRGKTVPDLRLPEAQSVRCFAALDDDICPLESHLPMLVEDTKWVEIYKLTNPDINQPAHTTQVVALDGIRYTDILHIADELTRTFQIHRPHLITAAISLLRSQYVVGATYTEWNVLHILHAIHQRLAPETRLMQFALYKPPCKPVTRRGTRRRSSLKLMETA